MESSHYSGEGPEIVHAQRRELVYDVRQLLWGDMPVRFEFDYGHKILLVLFEGDMRDAEAFTIKAKVVSYMERLRPLAGIADLSGVKTFDVSGQTMRTVARQPPHPEEIPRFIVAPQDHVFGMARMYELTETKTEGKMHVVRSREQALETMGVKDAKFEPVELPEVI
jgi:hypothetical protein